MTTQEQETQDEATNEQDEQDEQDEQAQAPEYEFTLPDEQYVDFSAFNSFQKATWERQQRFLFYYRTWGTKGSCARRARIERTIVYLWEKQNTFGFKQRIDDAIEEFVNNEEDRLRRLAVGLKPGHNATAIIARLNKESDAWNRQNVVITDERGKEVLDMLSERRKAAIIEGESRALPIEEGMQDD